MIRWMQGFFCLKLDPSLHFGWLLARLGRPGQVLLAASSVCTGKSRHGCSFMESHKRHAAHLQGRLPWNTHVSFSRY